MDIGNMTNKHDTVPAELERLRQALKKAEQSRLSDEPTVSLDEARKRLNEKYHKECGSK